MGWYGDYQKIDFDKRNLLNDKIRYLESIPEKLAKLAELIYQSANTAKETNLNIINDKKMSSYPEIRDILIEADFIALDSPWQFEMILIEAIDVINSQITKLMLERKENNDINKDSDSKWKGWV